MSDVERTGWRDRAYSTWHRNLPWHLGFMDVDWIEWCKAPYCGRIVAIYELSADFDKLDKEHTKTLQLAKRADIRAYVVLYKALGKTDIAAVRARVIYPHTDNSFTDYTPDEWAAHLKSLRCHEVQAKPEVVPHLAIVGSRIGCATCGAPPVGSFMNGSPRFSCGPHEPVLAAVSGDDAWSLF